MLDDGAVVQAEAVEVVGQLDFGEALHEAVVEPCAWPNMTGDSLAADLDAHDDLVALLPLLQELGDQLERLLQVGDKRDHRVAAGLQEGVIGRADVAEIAAVDDDLDVLVLGRQPPQDRRVRSVEALSMKMCS